MCSHLDMNTKPIPGLLAWVIAHSLPPSHLLLSFIPSSTPATPLSPSLSPPCKLDSGNITMLFSLFPSLWPNCLVFQDHWALFIGCTGNQRATQVFFLCLRATSEQRWAQEMDSILQHITRPPATDDCLLRAARCDRFITENVNKCSQEALR